MDIDGDGAREQVGWVAPDDGILVLDRNGNGKVDGYNEISFLDDFLGAGSDLEGLYAYDTDGDGFLTQADERFDDFLIWTDTNGNGHSDPHELSSLAELDISRLNLEKLTSDPLDLDREENQIVATTVFETADGSTGLVGDVALFSGDCGCHSHDATMLGLMAAGSASMMSENSNVQNLNGFAI